jgi:hypothetical protein
MNYEKKIKKIYLFIAKSKKLLTFAHSFFERSGAYIPSMLANRWNFNACYVPKIDSRTRCHLEKITKQKALLRR